ncbi:MAG: putative acylesterase/phospholipase RssA, partial [Paraglaciecola sp.]
FMTYKVAIAISGAVSLGSYEAGTMYEIINAIKLHNSQNSDDRQIKIDVLTGASAGGMTAALVAQKLLYESQALENPRTNVGYQAWVESVDIDGLLTPHEGDNPNTSIFSSGFVASIANKHMLNRYDSAPPKPSRHLASAQTIKLGLAMSNLNGVDYARNIFEETHHGLQDGKFVETRHQDRVTMELGPETDVQATWQRIATAARCCGAFPFVFSPLSMVRKWAEPDYKGRGAEDFSQRLPGGKFSFMDGGAFNNYPLGMARELVTTIDKDPLDYSKRFYFYISPHKKVSTMDETFDASSPGTLMQHAALKMAGALFTQARFQDWIMTDKVNKDVALLDKRAVELVDYIQDAPDEAVANMAKVAKELCQAIYALQTPDKIQNGKTDVIEPPQIQGAQPLEQAITRLTRQYKEDYPDFDNLPAVKKEAWLYSIALLEKAANLGTRDIMRVYTITAQDKELASEELMSFLGFLDKRYREYDYLRGRLNAVKVLNHIIRTKNDPDLGAIHLPLNISELDTTEVQQRLDNLALGDATIGDVKLATRNDLFERIKERFYLYTRKMGMNWLLRVSLFNFFVKGKLKGYLQLNR